MLPLSICADVHTFSDQVNCQPNGTQNNLPAPMAVLVNDMLIADLSVYLLHILTLEGKVLIV